MFAGAKVRIKEQNAKENESFFQEKNTFVFKEVSSIGKHNTLSWSS